MNVEDKLKNLKLKGKIRKHGTAVVPPEPKEEGTVKIGKREFEKVIVRTEEQKKKLTEARRLTNRKKGSIGDNFDYEVRVERAKIGDLEVTDNNVSLNSLNCGYCEGFIEGQSIGDLKYFLKEYLHILEKPWVLREKGADRPRNITKTFERQCPQCGFSGIRGKINVEIKDSAIERAKAKRFKDRRDSEVFGGVLSFKDFMIDGGKFPRGTTYLHKEIPTVLRYACGSCGHEGFALNLQTFFGKLLKNVENAWDTGKSVKPERVDAKFRCSRCVNELRIKGNVAVDFPKTRKETIQAFKLWQRDVNQLMFEKTEVSLGLDFEKAFYEARAKEKQGGEK